MLAHAARIGVDRVLDRKVAKHLARARAEVRPQPALIPERTDVGGHFGIEADAGDVEEHASGNLSNVDGAIG